MTPADAEDRKLPFPASGDSTPEVRLTALIQDVKAGLRNAPAIAAEIGPEWENVVEEMQLSFCESLSELESRLADRIEKAEG